MRPQALIEAVSANLNWFLQPIGQNLTKPQKKFLRDGLIGLLRGRRGDWSAGWPGRCRTGGRSSCLVWTASKSICNRSRPVPTRVVKNGREFR